MSNVLIVEDDPSIRSLYATVLKQQGYSVQEARDAKEGLQALADAQPQLIILDLLMPGENGISFLKTADVEHQYPGVKVLVASNVDSSEFAQELEHFKVDRYIVKSEYNPYRLADLVREMLG